MKKLPNKVAKRKTDELPREAALRILKLRGELTVEELCVALKLTHTGVRRHLARLLREQLVTVRQHQNGPGRPLQKFRLTEKAAASEPTGYENLVAQLVDTVFEHNGHVAVMELLKANNNRLSKLLLPRFAGKSLKQRTEEVARFFRDNGYSTDWTPLQNGNFFLFHQNCAIHQLAFRFRQFCIVEPRLIECLLQVKVTRQQYIFKGEPVCGYFIDASRPLERQASSMI